MSEWIRRFWGEFCRSPLAKRLFGRFLARFLDAGHFLQIAESFYALDNQGTGTINLKELQLAARKASHPPESVEVVIDGRALCHAFESLEDDGSEQGCTTSWLPWTVGLPLRMW
eukprot:s2801_g4.t1